jgi:hypothetical protein
MLCGFLPELCCAMTQRATVNAANVTTSRQFCESSRQFPLLRMLRDGFSSSAQTSKPRKNRASAFCPSKPSAWPREIAGKIHKIAVKIRKIAVKIVKLSAFTIGKNPQSISLQAWTCDSPKTSLQHPHSDSEDSKDEYFVGAYEEESDLSYEEKRKLEDDDDLGVVLRKKQKYVPSKNMTSSGIGGYDRKVG